MEIKEILEKMNEQKEIMNEGPEEDPRTRTAREMRRREALDEYEKYRSQYHKALKDAVAFIPVVGGKARIEEFRPIAEDEGTSIIIDGDKMFREYADYFSNFIGDGGLFGVGEALTLRNLIYRTSRELNVPVVIHEVDEGTHSVADYEDLVSVIRSIYFRMTDSNLLKAYIANQIVEEAELISYDLPILPVIVFGLTKEEVLRRFDSEFLGKKMFVINLSKTPPSEEVLINTYRGIKNNRMKAREESRGDNE